MSSPGVGSAASAAAPPPLPLRPAFAAEPREAKAPPGQPRRADGRLREPMSAPGGGISRLVSPRLARAARAVQAGTAAAPARESGLGLAAAGSSAWGVVGGRRPPSSTMPGIDKLPIEETLEDSPQVRRRCVPREGAGRADPRPAAAVAAGARSDPGGRRSPVLPPFAGHARSHRGPAARSRPSWAFAARPRAARGVRDVGRRRPSRRRLRSWARWFTYARGAPFYVTKVRFLSP